VELAWMMRDWGTGSPPGRLIPEIGRCSLQKKTSGHGHDPRAIQGPVKNPPVKNPKSLPIMAGST
jgi:hypothetical protein